MKEKGVTTITLKKNKSWKSLSVYLSWKTDFQIADRAGSADGTFYSKPKSECNLAGLS